MTTTRCTIDDLATVLEWIGAYEGDDQIRQSMIRGAEFIAREISTRHALSLEQQKAMAAIETQRLKAQADIQLAREKAAAELQLKQQEFEVEAQLKAAKIGAGITRNVEIPG